MAGKRTEMPTLKLAKSTTSTLLLFLGEIIKQRIVTDAATSLMTISSSLSQTVKRRSRLQTNRDTLKDRLKMSKNRLIKSQIRRRLLPFSLIAIYFPLYLRIVAPALMICA